MATLPTDRPVNPLRQRMLDDMAIRNLRAKFARAGAADLIETRAGIGYRLGACAGASASP